VPNCQGKLDPKGCNRKNCPRMQTKICDKSRCAGHAEHTCPIVHKLNAATSIIAGELKFSRLSETQVVDYALFHRSNNTKSAGMASLR
jgi:hypothetical protein